MAALDWSLFSCILLGPMQAYDRALVRLRGIAAATNFALSDYRSDLADYHKMQQVWLSWIGPLLLVVE